MDASPSSSVATRLTASHGIAAASALRDSGVAGVDAFVESCRANPSPELVYMSSRALGALVAANVDVYSLDRSSIAVLRYLGFPLYSLAADRAITPGKLREIYSRLRSRRPRRHAFLPVFPTVRAMIMSCLRTGTSLRDVERSIPRVETEMRSTLMGLLTFPACTTATRNALFAVITMAIAWGVVASARVRDYARELMGETAARATVSGVRQASGLYALISIGWLVRTLFREHCRDPKRAQLRASVLALLVIPFICVAFA